MRRAAWTIAGACALDAVIGDPSWLPHPVRAMGAAIAFGDRRLNRDGQGTELAGAALALSVIALSAVSGVLVQRSFVAAVVLGGAMLATRDLLREAGAVAAALESSDLALARVRVARIVGRDTGRLDAAEVARAAVETVAESACDGIVAPLCWFALGGLPGALAFKAANTLDSMIGHRDPRYLRFGAFAARADDALNYVPARLTAGLIALASGTSARAVRVAFADAARHASPNAGWPEAALAGALDVQLGGSNAYDGVVHAGAVFNAGARPCDARDVRRAMRIVGVASAIAQLCAVAARA